MSMMHEFGFSSRRSPVSGLNGMVATSQPLASQAGLAILQNGGNAADAAVAAASMLNVVEPCSTGIGGDVFALFYNSSTKQVECLMGAGKSPSNLTLQHVRDMGIKGTQLPSTHALTVTIPGAASAWEQALAKWGKLDLKTVLKPAIDTARNGFSIGPVTARIWQESVGVLEEAGEEAVKTFLAPDKQAPRQGQVMQNKDLADTFQRLGEHGAKKGFYEGPIADAIVDALQTRGGVLNLDDLKNFEATFVKPISTNYRGFNVYQVPPPTHGISVLLALNHLEEQQQFGKTVKWGSADHLHHMVESMRLAFADVLEFNGDPDVHPVPIDKLCSKTYAKQRRQQAWESSSHEAAVLTPSSAAQEILQDIDAKQQDTVYFCVVDGEGNACSFINSNYQGFGTGIVPQGCGFTLQNRGYNFILQENHPNCLAPNKRPYHTIIPGIMTDDGGDLFCAYGVMGGFMQPQGHLQVISNMCDFGMDPQQALDAPRFMLQGVNSNLGPACVQYSNAAFEEGHNEIELQKLKRLFKHDQILKEVAGYDRIHFGKGQIVRRDKQTGLLTGGSDPRSDGLVAAC